MKQFDCLDRRTDIFGYHFLEASAGTGKTFSIEHIFVRLLLDQNSSLSLEQILVVTFTKAATRDLQERIKNNLMAILTICKQQRYKTNIKRPFLFDYLEDILSDDQQLEKTIEKLEQMIFFFDRAQIHTIHGFCFSSLRDMPFEAGHVFGEEEKEQLMSFSLMKKQVKNFLLYFINDHTYHPEQIAIVVKGCKGFDKLCEKLVKTKSVDNKISSFIDDYKEFNKRIRLYDRKILFSIDEIKEEFSELFDNYKKNKKYQFDEMLFQVSLLAKIISQKTCSEEEFGQILQTKLTIGDFLQNNNKKKKSSFSLEKAHTSYFFLFIKQQLLEVVKTATNFITIFYRLSKECSQYLQCVLEKSNQFTYDSLLEKMRQSLKKKNFLQKLRERYRVAIIDEFQDTDPLQWDIFKTIFLKHSEAFYIIGDPKQSIYAFRQADIYTYLDAAKAFGQKNLSYLNKNYRSAASLVYAINELFSKTSSSKWLYLPKKQDFLSYRPIEATERDSVVFSDNNKPIHFFLAEENNKQSVVEKEKNFFFPFILKEIQKICQKISYEDIAILVKDRYQAQRLISFLEQHQIPYIAKSHLSILEAPSFRFLKEFFDAVLSPHDRNKIKIVLSGPYMRKDISYLNEISLEEETSLISIFCFLRKQLFEKGMGAFFQTFLSISWGQNKSTIIENIMSSTDPFFYRDTMQLIELILDEQNTKKIEDHEINRLFEDLLSIDPEEDERVRRRIFFDEKGIQILTIHMSKGLEYSVVFALGLAFRSTTSPLVSQKQREEYDAEKLRQLYVAITRAKYRVYVPFLLKKVSANQSISSIELFFHMMTKTSDDTVLINSGLDKDKILSFLNSLNMSSYEFLKEDNSNNIVTKKKDDDILLSFHPLKYCQTEAFLLSFSQINKHKDFLKDKIIKDSFFSSQYLPPSAETGIVLHHILEQLFNGKNKNFYFEEVYRPIIDSVLFRTHLCEEKERIYEMIKRLLQVKLPDTEKVFCLEDVSVDRMTSEIGFLFPFYAQNMMKGFIDFIFFHSNKFYLVDWKSNWLGDEEKDYDKKSLEKAMEHNNYFLQAAIYTEAFRRYLGEKKFSKQFGGVYYIFLRGLEKNPFSQRGIYHFFPERKEIEKEVVCLA